MLQNWVSYDNALNHIKYNFESVTIKILLIFI